MRSAAVLSLVGFSFVLGCSASKINYNDPSQSRYAPNSERQEITAEVSYCNAGAKSIRDSRREDAYKKMYEACSGSYEIVREEDQSPPFCLKERRIWFKCTIPSAKPAAKPAS